MGSDANDGGGARKRPPSAEQPDRRPRVSPAVHQLIDAEMDTAFRWNVARDRKIRVALTRLHATNPLATPADRDAVIQKIAAKFAAGLKLQLATLHAQWRAANPPKPEARDPEKERLKAERDYLVAELKRRIALRKTDPGCGGVRHDVFLAGWDGVRLQLPQLPSSPVVDANAQKEQPAASHLLNRPSTNVRAASADAIPRISAEMTAAFKKNVAKGKADREELRKARKTQETPKARTALWQAVKQANPDLTDEEVTAAINPSVTIERHLVLNKGLNLDQARELARAELFPNEDGDME
jgi:hypothetical protein